MKSNLNHQVVLDSVDVDDLRGRVSAALSSIRRLQHFYRSHDAAAALGRKVWVEKQEPLSPSIVAHLADRAFEVEPDLWSLLRLGTSTLNFSRDSGIIEGSIKIVRQAVEGKKEVPLRTLLASTRELLDDFLVDADTAWFSQLEKELDAHEIRVSAMANEGVMLTSTLIPDGVVIDGRDRPGNLGRLSPDTLFTPVTRGGFIANPFIIDPKGEPRTMDIYDSVFGSMFNARDLHYALARRLDEGQLGEHSGNDPISAGVALFLLIAGLALAFAGGAMLAILGCGNASRHADPGLCALAAILLIAGTFIASIGCAHYPGCTLRAARTPVPGSFP